MFQLITNENEEKTIETGMNIRSETPILPSINNYNLRENRLTALDILSIINRRKNTIIISTLIAIMLSLFYSFSQIPSYQANAIIEIERDNTEIVEFGQIRKPNEVFQVQNDPIFKTRYEMLKSKVIANRVIEKLNLSESLSKGKTKDLQIGKKLKTLFGLKSIKPTPNKNQVPDYTQDFLGRLRVNAIQGTHLVEIKYQGATPNEAKTVIENIIAEYIKFQIKTNNDSDEYAKEFLRKQLYQSAQRLKQAETKLNGYANEKGILKVDDQQGSQIKKLEKLNDALVNAEIKRIVAETIYKESENSKSVQPILTNPLIMRLKETLLVQETEYQKILKTSTKKSRKARAIEQQIKNLQIKINTEIAKIRESLKSEYITAKNQETKIRGQLRLFKLDLQNLQNTGLIYTSLKREVNSSENLYKNILQRLQEVNVASAVNTNTIKILEPPILPLKKYRPNHKINLLLGTFAGLVLGLCFTFLRESLDKNFKTQEELEIKTGLPVLGRIPQAQRKTIPYLDTIVADDPHNPISEAYRILSANIQLITDRMSQRIIMVTSSHSGEGKSITACNMACAYARMGKKVLLIDADIRRPSQHQRFNLDNSKGLSNYLKGETNFSGITQHIKKIGGLFVITGGEQNDDPVSLLSNGNMEHLTQQGARVFDYVIIDAPPVIGFADTLLLTSFSTATLIVSSQQSLDEQGLKLVMSKLARIKPNLLGFSLINVKNPEAQNRFYTDYMDAPNVIQMKVS